MRTLNVIMNSYLYNDSLIEIFKSANKWFTQNIKIELLNKLSGTEYTQETLSNFDLAKCKLCDIFINILTKDKGIGVFERTSNIVKNYKQLLSIGHRINKTKFIESLQNTYFQENKYINPIKGKENVKYSNYFMKGRKEGIDNTKFNYYNKTILYTRTNNNNFENVGKLILSLYDIITFEMTCEVEVPMSFDDNTEITSKKYLIIEEYINRNNLDAMFITEYLPNSLETNSTLNSSLKIDYNIIIGEVLNDVANAIIYKKSLGEFTCLTFPNDYEFKERPLVIRNDYFSMICFHAGGKGILENVSKFTETHLYKYIESCDNKVIVGGDFNCNIYKNCEIFSVSENENIGITSFKKRTCIQSQLDKSNIIDKSKKDDFVLKDCSVVNCNVTMIDENDETHEVEIYKDCNETHLIPNNSHPFDHYFVNYTVSLEPVPNQEESYTSIIYNLLLVYLHCKYNIFIR